MRTGSPVMRPASQRTAIDQELPCGIVGLVSYPEGPAMPASRARTIASARVRTPSLLKMADT